MQQALNTTLFDISRALAERRWTGAPTRRGPASTGPRGRWLSRWRALRAAVHATARSWYLPASSSVDA
eukprot:3283845-Rhodomonas_salina.2